MHLLASQLIIPQVRSSLLLAVGKRPLVFVLLQAAHREAGLDALIINVCLVSRTETTSRRFPTDRYTPPNPARRELN